MSQLSLKSEVPIILLNDDTNVETESTKSFVSRFTYDSELNNSFKSSKNSSRRSSIYQLVKSAINMIFFKTGR